MEEEVDRDRNTVTHLYNAANVMTDNAVKSYYLTTCFIGAVRGNVIIPSKFMDVMIRCTKCLLNRTQENTSYFVKPEKHLIRFEKKLQNKETKLTKFQRKYLKKMKGSNENTLILTCKVCGKIDEKPLTKPKPLSKQLPEVTAVRSKKNKKKDRLSGLNANAVLSAKKTPNNALMGGIKASLENTDDNVMVKKKLHFKTQPITPVPAVSLKTIKKNKAKNNKKMTKLNAIFDKDMSKSKSGLKEFLMSMQ